MAHNPICHLLQCPAPAIHALLSYLDNPDELFRTCRAIRVWASDPLALATWALHVYGSKEALTYIWHVPHFFRSSHEQQLSIFKCLFAENCEFQSPKILQKAAAAGNLKIVQLIVKQGASSLAKGAALIAAAAKGFGDIVLFLITSGFPHTMLDVAREALCAASNEGHLHIVQILAAAGVPVGGDGAALCSAAHGGHANIIKELVKRGASGLGRRCEAGLVGAASCGYVDVMRELLNAGTSVHCADEGALRAAATAGSAPAVSELLARGASPFVGDVAPLRTCIGPGGDEVLTLMLNAGAAVNVRHGEPLRHAAAMGCTEQVVKLLAAGATTTLPSIVEESCGSFLQDGTFASPLQAAVFNRHTAVVKALLAGPTKLSERDVNLARELASGLGCGEILDLLYGYTPAPSLEGMHACFVEAKMLDDDDDDDEFDA